MHIGLCLCDSCQDQESAVCSHIVKAYPHHMHTTPTTTPQSVRATYFASLYCYCLSAPWRYCVGCNPRNTKQKCCDNPPFLVGRRRVILRKPNDFMSFIYGRISKESITDHQRRIEDNIKAKGVILKCHIKKRGL